MISKAHTGSGFAGLRDYLLYGPKGSFAPERAQWIATRNLPNEDPHLATQIMRATADQSIRCTKPVYHMMIAFPAGEVPDRNMLDVIVDRHLEALDLSDHQALIVAHGDTDHYHVHVVVNRIHPETCRAARLSWDYAKRERCRRELEREFELEEVYAPHVDYDGRYGLEKSNEDNKERQRPLNTSKVVHWDQNKVEELKRHFKPQLDVIASWEELEDRTAEIGGELHRNGQGLIVTDGHNYAKWSQLSPKKHRLGELEKRFRQSFDAWTTKRDLEADLSPMEKIKQAGKRKGFKRRGDRGIDDGFDREI